MAIEGEYVPSQWDWVAKQIDQYESSGGTEGVTIQGAPVIVMTMRGRRSGNVRKAAVMRVEHDGTYAAVASKGGSPENPGWYHNLMAHPDITLQDGTESRPMRAREAEGDERAAWWARAVAAYPPYAEYQTRTDREIPVFVLEPA